jgi:hypothetical protein
MRTEGLNMRGLFSFPIERYAAILLPSWAPPNFRFWGSKSVRTKPKNAPFER